MKKLGSKLVMAVLLALVAGCYSLETAPMRAGGTEPLKIRASGGQPVEHIVVANSGWFLFNFCPLACGNANADSWCRCVFFRNDMQDEILQDRLTAYARTRGYDIEELNLFNDEQVMFSIPGLETPVIIPYLMTYRRKQFSAVLVQRPKPPPPDPHARHRQEITREVDRLLGTIPDGGTK